MGTHKSLRERKKEQTRRDFVRAAMELFHEQGYEATSVEDIADRANYSRATFFRYFQGKEDVVFAGALEHLATKLAALTPAEVSVDPLRTVRQTITLHMGEIVSLSDRNWVRVVLGDPTLRRRYAEEGLRAQEEIAELFAAAWGVDAATSAECHVLGAAVIGICHAAFGAQLHDEDPQVVIEVLDRGFNFLEQGFQYQPPTDALRSKKRRNAEQHG